MTKDNTTYSLIVYFLILFTPAIAPQKNKIKFEHLSIEQGLSQNFVQDILQDQQGFLWFATEDGLNRYDGNEFKIYRHDTNNPKSISDNVILNLYEDDTGILWIGTRSGGVNIFDSANERFEHIRHNPDDTTSLSSDWVLAVHKDKSGILWIGTNGGGLNSTLLNSIKSKNGSKKRSSLTFIHYRYISSDSLSLSSDRVSSICEDSLGTLWFGTYGGGLNKFDRENGKFTHYKNDKDDITSLRDNGVNTIYNDNSGNLWIGTNGGGLNKFNREKEQFIYYKYASIYSTSTIDYQVMALYEDGRNNFWIGTFGGGLKKFDRAKKHADYYKLNLDDSQSISSNVILSIIEDNSGVMWFGTLGGGINKVDAQKDKFINYKYQIDDPLSLNDDGILSVFVDKSGILWIGTGLGGLNKLDGDNEQFEHYIHDIKDPSSISGNTVFSICEDDKGLLWIATGESINSFEKEKDRFTNYNVPGLYSKAISILIDNSGILWLGTELGLFSYNPVNNQSKHFVHDPGNPNSLASDFIVTIYQDRTGILWIGNWNDGMDKFDIEKNLFTHYKHDPNDISSISHNNIKSILEDKSGTLWIGTNSGLNKFDKQKEVFTHYGEADGLPSDVIFGILEDDHGNLWLSTNKGLSRYDTQNETFKNYDVRDGIQGNSFNPGACSKTKLGELVFGGENGFTLFHPDSLKDNTHIPPIVLTDFKLFNKSVKVGLDSLYNREILCKSITKAERIELTHHDYVFTLEFASLDFRNPDKNKYAYIMEGFDKDWTYTDASRRTATYTNLDPGEYTFRVKGSNNDGIWNEEGASINIIILPPWWETTWAYVMYLLLALCLIYFTWKFQLKRIRIKHDYEMSKFESKKLHEIDEMKSRFFANISHEFRTPLTLILGPVKEFINKEINSKKKEELSVVYRNADRLNELVNQLLDLSKLEARKMTLLTSKEDIIPLLKGLVLSFASLAERKKIKLNFNSRLSELKVYLDRDKFEKIVNNLLSNAFKFTPENGNIEVNVGKTTEYVEIKIADTGIGIPKNRLANIFDRFYQVDSSHSREQEGTGIGLALTKELVELHKGKIKIESEEKKGTTFTVVLPLGRAHLTSNEIREKMEVTDEIIPYVDNIIPESEFKEETLNVELYTKTEKPLILIVEDNADVRNYIKGYLEREYMLMEANNGEEGLQKSFEHIPDLIISDVMMPKIDGFLLCEKLKTDDRTSHIPVILLTAKSSGQDKIEGLETGADDYIMKPFDAKELQIRVKNLIEQRKKIIEHFRKQELFETSDLQITPRNKKFVSKAIEIINDHISDENFDVNTFASEIGLSRVQLHRKLSALIGHSSSDLIRIIRLTKAARLLRSNFGNVSEIALEVGFNNPANFAKIFRAHFGVSPSDYKKNSFPSQ